MARAPAPPRRLRGTVGPRATARNGDAGSRRRGGEAAPEPAVWRALHAGGARLHVVLGVEVRARGVGRAAGVHDRERPRVPEGLEGRQGRMQAEEPVEVDGALGRSPRPASAMAMLGRATRYAASPKGTTMPRPSAAPRRNTPTRTRRPRGSLAAAARRRKRGADPKATAASAAPRRNDRRLDERGAAEVRCTHRRWNSGEPSTSAATFSTSVRAAWAGLRSSDVARAISGSAR